MLTTEEIVDYLINHGSEGSAVLSALWIPVSGSRADLARTLEKQDTTTPILPVVIRKASFNDPNAVLNDFADLLQEHRARVCALFERYAGRVNDARCIFALLAKAELKIPQTGSPIALPQWFPIQPGQTIDITIEDITWKASSPVNDANTRVSELCELLVQLEDALRVRLQRVLETDHKKTNKLTELFRRADAKFDTYSGALRIAADARREVQAASAFRPSLANQKTIVARLAAIGLSTSPAASTAVAEALADALDLDNLTPGYYESYLALLWRPNHASKSDAVKFCRNLLCTLTGTYQLVTAAAHASEYACYSPLILRALSFDLRKSMEHASVSLSEI